MKKIIVGIVIISLIIVVALFLFITRPIKIGVILTKDNPLGNEENSAINYYKNAYPKIGMRPVKYIIYNPAITEEEIQACYKKLENAGVSVILGGSISKSGIIIAKEAERSGVPTFGITSSSHSLSGKKDNFYRVVSSTNFIGPNMARYMNGIKKKHVVILTSIDNKAYADPLAKVFKEMFTGTTTIIPYASEEVIEQAIKHDPDVILSILPETSLIQVIKKVKSDAPDILLISTEWGFARLPSMFSGAILDGVQSYNRFLDVIPEYKDLVTGFEDTYDIQATFAAVNAFSCLRLIYQAIEEVGAKPKKINEYLMTPRFFKFGYGLLYLNEYGDAIYQYHYIKEMKDNKMISIDTIEVFEFPREK